MRSKNEPGQQDGHSGTVNGRTEKKPAETNDRNHEETPSKGSEDIPSESGASSEAFESKYRFDALVRERDSLRADVADMRRSLEEIQSKHGAEMESLQGKANEAENKKEHAEVQFQKLLERVNIIKAQLGERLKEDAVCHPSRHPMIKTNAPHRKSSLKQKPPLNNYKKKMIV